MPNKKEGNKLEAIEIPQIRRETFKLTIIGDTPLLCHCFSDRSKQRILETQTEENKPKKKHVPKNPPGDFVDSLYWMTERPEFDYVADKPEEVEKVFVEAVKKGARFGFPSTGIKKSAASAGKRAGLVKDMVTALGFFQIPGKLVEIKGSIPEIDEANVRIPSTGGADMRYRARFDNWKITFGVICSQDVFPKEKVVNLINYAGFCVGIGDWRPEKKGSMGMFHVAGSDEI